MLFLGITMAIWFNNWNENLKSRKIEIKSLIEIKNAIQQDLFDIEENIFRFDKRVILYQLLPLSYETMIRDFQFQQNIYWALRTDSYMLDLYRELKETAESLIIEFDHELERLN